MPKALDGKPDLSGVWDHPFAMNMAVAGRGDNCGTGAVNGCKMAGPEGGAIPMTPAGEAWFKSYDATNYDATAHCNPMGYTRSMNAPVPTQIVQEAEDVIVFLHESMFAFHNVYMDGRKHPTKAEALESYLVWTLDGKVGWRHAGDRHRRAVFWHSQDASGHRGPSHERRSASRRAFQAPGLRSSPVRHYGGRSEILHQTVDQFRAYGRSCLRAREILEYVCTENNKEVDEHHVK